MRIIGNIPAPDLKITVFESGNRLLIKFEDEEAEQTYKFRKGKAVERYEDVRQLVDEAFISEVRRELTRMKQIKQAALRRGRPGENQNEFDKII
ncbi:MAG: hypothetical protein R3350_10550 [Saprospiraceae bacterium]|nr:hypothetical protein [Saprospiraceae bacterium]